MTIYTQSATRRDSQNVAVHGLASAVKVRTATTELAAAASTSTVDFGNFPTSARLLGASQLYWDDLATSGSPTLDIGLFAVNNSITSDDDIINDGLVLSSASTGTRVVKDVANYGKTLWELLGLSADPGGLVAIRGTVRDAATTATGTITAEIYYEID